MPRVDAHAPRSERHASEEEQRRLFYVAATRATATLVLSSVTAVPLALARQMGLAFGKEETVETIASRYLAELGPSKPAAVRGDAFLAALAPLAAAS